MDEGGSLKVGPRSAGADPGPACYGKGREPTVTDANLVLGRLRAESFLGGEMSVDMERARRALRPLARDMGCASVEEAAEGIVRVVEGNMERAIRLITVARGQDPRSACLVAFGGAAGLHACGLADELGISRLMIPADPGLLSALGVADGPVLRDETRPLRIVDAGLDALRELSRPMAAAARAYAVGEGVAGSRVRVQSFVRMRYLGQSMEVEVPLRAGFRRRFDAEHQRLYHYAAPLRSVEITALRATACGRVAAEVSALSPGRAAGAGTREALDTASVHIGGRVRLAPIYRREDLPLGSRLSGPAILVEYSSTVLLAARWSLRVDAARNLLLESERSPGAQSGARGAPRRAAGSGRVKAAAGPRKGVRHG